VSAATPQSPSPEQPSVNGSSDNGPASPAEPADAYLKGANYYRLAYQLIAQQAHAVLSAQATAPNNGQVVQSAEQLAAQIQQTLGGLEARQRDARYPWQRGLLISQKRLQLFLAETVEPCTLLIVAAQPQNLQVDPQEFVNQRRPQRQIVSFDWRGQEKKPIAIRWSYRAYYNLACSYAAGLPPAPTDAAVQTSDPASEPPIQDRVARAFTALEKALRLVHGRPRVELWRWAKKDPALATLKKYPGETTTFDLLLGEYAPAAVKAAEESPLDIVEQPPDELS
jgi:hypothetical protein